MDQNEVARLIDEAVDCWHQVAEEHDIPSCNCFRDKFAKRLIDLGIFVGYDNIDQQQDTASVICSSKAPSETPMVRGI